MTLTERNKAFIHLGNFLSQFAEHQPYKKENIPNNDLFFEGMLHQIKLAEEYNGWFTNENIRFALKNWSETLTENNLSTWVSAYSFNSKHPKTVAIIMAGNIPLVGFHDFLSVLISGNKVLVKQSTKDKQLLPYLAKYLEHIDAGFKKRISFTEGQLTDFDAVIATGSNNTARYFEYYFKNKPHIIRKNRNSVAVITGNETESQLSALGEDIFRYYGLGCRNVSKLMVPENYNFDQFFNAIYPWHTLMDKQKYANNYDYNKAVYLMSEFKFLDNGFFMLKEDKGYSSPIASCFYEFYTSKETLKHQLHQDQEHLQCIVSDGFTDFEVAFGQTQQPGLWDYADTINTLDFLLKI